MEFKSIKGRLNLWFFLVAIIPLLTVVLIIYQQRVESIKEQAFNKLIAIRDLKVTQVQNWLVERSGDIELLAEEPEVRMLEDVIDSEEPSSLDLEKIFSVRESLIARIKNYRDYTELFLISAKTGKVVISSRRDSEGADRSKNAFFTVPLQTRSLFIKDIHYSKTMNREALTFSAPVFAYGNKDEIIGVVVARIDLDQSLYDMLLDRPGMGDTGETLIVNSDVVALNELRWHQNAPLKLRIKSQPAVMAALGKTGIIETRDYRQKKVLAAYTFISGPGWGFVAKQDQDEIYGPIDKLLRNCLVILGISILVVYLVSLVVARNLSSPLVSIAEFAKKLNAGDLSARIRLKRADELGSLASSLDSTAEAMTERMMFQEQISEIMAAIVASEEIAAFAKNILQKMTDLTSSELGSFHLLDHNENEFVPVAYFGVSKELLGSTDGTKPAGEIGKAIQLGLINHVKNIPEDTVFRLKTFSGEALPREIINIPIVIDDKTEAVISLATLRGYTPLDLEVIHASRAGLTTGLASLLANERTRDLAVNLEHTNIELEQQKGELQRQSEELQEQNIELGLQRKQVEEANRLKSEFLSNMSHELRTPLNSIMSLSKVLNIQVKEKLSEEEHNYLSVIERNGRMLLALVNDILDLAKIEAGRMDVRTSTFSVRAMLESILESLAAISAEKGILIRNEIPEDLPLVKSDQNRLHQVLQNIISNAVKFTQEGSVTVSAEGTKQNIIIKVADTGIGIDQKDLPHIFEEFRQVDGSSSRRFEGTGLGLAIAKKAIDLLGGDISVASELGRGSVFTMRVPVSCTGTELAEIFESPDFVYQAQAEGRTAAGGRRGVNGERILVVEDNAETISQVRDALENGGYKVITATGGAEALEIIQSTIPDGIVLDLMMPEVDGFEVLDKLRGTEATSQIPVLVLTAKNLDKEDFKKLSANNIQQLVQKGDIDLKGLLFKIELMLGSRAKLAKPSPASAERTKAEFKQRSAGREKPLLLAVEDNPDNLVTLRAILKDRFEILAATDGEEGLRKTLDHLPDLVLLDIALPKMDGFAVVRAIKGNDTTKNIPVVALTASAMAGDREKILAAGCDDYISKPIDAEILIRCIDKWLGK